MMYELKNDNYPDPDGDVSAILSADEGVAAMRKQLKESDNGAFVTDAGVQYLTTTQPKNSERS